MHLGVNLCLSLHMPVGQANTEVGTVEDDCFHGRWHESLGMLGNCVSLIVRPVLRGRKLETDCR